MDIPYTIKTRKGSRTIRISIHANGSVVVTKPARVTQRDIEKLVDKRQEWIKEQQTKLAARPKKLLAHYSAKDFKLYKDKAYELAVERIAHFNSLYQYSFANITIRNQSTRWGSCSRKRNLNFNYKIAFLPPHLADYIIVHELCHLAQMNHGPQFWALVTQTIPDYKQCRADIRSY